MALMNKLNLRSKGQHYEQMAAEFLRRHGLQLVDQNFLAKGGELDLVMRERNSIVFIEVKYRKNQNHGHAAETVTWRKQQRLIKAANWWMLKKGLNADSTDFRFDVVAIHNDGHHIEWIKNAITEG